VANDSLTFRPANSLVSHDTQAAVLRRRRTASFSESGTLAVWLEPEAAATLDSVDRACLTLFWSGRIDDHIGGGLVGGKPVGAPFGFVAEHVEQAETVPLLGHDGGMADVGV